MPTVNISFTVTAALVQPYYDEDPYFLDLMVHTCTIIRAGEATSVPGTYGHRHKDYDTAPAASYPGIVCRLRSLSAEEIVIIGRDSEVIQDMYLDVPASQLPESLKDDTAAARHQVSDVRMGETGELVKTGPFDIQSVRLMAGEQHHYLLLLRKAGQ